MQRSNLSGYLGLHDGAFYQRHKHDGKCSGVGIGFDVTEFDAFLDQATGQSFYRAEILLTPGEMAKLDGQALLPGMPVEAFIQTGERTPLAYLLQPFTDYFRRAFRET